MVGYTVAAVAYLLITGVVAVASRARARVLVLVCSAIAGVVVLLPVGGVVWPMPLCNTATGVCQVGGSQARTLIGVVLTRVGEPDAAEVGVLATLVVVSLALLAAAVGTSPRFTVARSSSGWWSGGRG
jgi:hypothetical protein